MPARLGAVLWGAAFLQACSGPKVLSNNDACNFLSSPERSKHNGPRLSR